MKNAILGLAFCAAMPLFAQQKATVTVHPEQGKQIINKEIYGQFAEHLGTCIYGGLWVGEDSSIPNIKGCLLYTSPSPRDRSLSRMPSSA